MWASLLAYGLWGLMPLYFRLMAPAGAVVSALGIGGSVFENPLIHEIGLALAMVVAAVAIGISGGAWWTPSKRRDELA